MILAEDERLIRVAEALYGRLEDSDPLNPIPDWEDLTAECRYQMLRRAKSCCEELARIVSENPYLPAERLIEKLARSKVFSPE